MDGSAPQSEGMRAIIALEASTFFSLPAWFAIADPAWPAGNPGAFFTAVAVGAASALVLCHVVPALWGRIAGRTLQGRVWRFARFLIACWLVIGAMLSLSATARIGGTTLRVYHYANPDYRFWNMGAIALAGVYAAAAMAIAMSPPRLRKTAGVLCCALGVGVLTALFVAQSRGLGTTNPQMAGEPEGYPERTLEAILAVAAPAAVVAFRIGKIGATTRQIWRSGVIAMVGPIVAASTLAATAKMCGARLHWKPSLPLEFTWAMSGWNDVPTVQAIWIIAGLTTVGSSIVFATWFAEATSEWNSIWRPRVGVAAAVGCALSMELLDRSWGFDIAYFRPWCWTVLIGSAVLGAGYLLTQTRKARS